MNIQTGRDVLIIVDQQLDFQTGGAIAVVGGDAIVDGINDLSEKFSEIILTQDHHPPGHISFASSYLDRPALSVITLDEFRMGGIRLSADAAFSESELADYLTGVRDNVQMLWPDHCVIGTDGALVDGRIRSERATMVLRKGYRAAADSYSAFRENDGATTGLAEFLTAKGVERIVTVGPDGDYGVCQTALDAHEAGFDVVCVEDLTRFIGVPEDSKNSCHARMREAGIRIASLAEILNAGMKGDRMG